MWHWMNEIPKSNKIMIIAFNKYTYARGKYNFSNGKWFIDGKYYKPESLAAWFDPEESDEYENK